MLTRTRLEGDNMLNELLIKIKSKQSILNKLQVLVTQKEELELKIIKQKEILRKDKEQVFVDLAGAETVNLDIINSDISLVRYVYANTVLNMEDIYSKVFVEFVDFVKV